MAVMVEGLFLTIDDAIELVIDDQVEPMRLEGAYVALRPEDDSRHGVFDLHKAVDGWLKIQRQFVRVEISLSAGEARLRPPKIGS